MKKNTKQMYLNLFMQHLLSLVTQDSCTSKKEGFGHDWYQNTWKRLKKYAIKIKYLIHDYKGFWTQISTLIHWHTYTDAKPNAKDLEAAPHIKNQVCIFVQNFKNWKLHFSTFLSKITIPLHSQGIKERFWIKTTASNARNW